MFEMLRQPLYLFSFLENYRMCVGRVKTTPTNSPAIKVNSEHITVTSTLIMASFPRKLALQWSYRLN